MRILFADPADFIQQSVTVALARGYNGYNADFEPW